MTLDELIAALEAATGPSRELDFWCWWWGKASHNGELPDADYAAANIKNDPGPRYTASIDAALTLVPEGWTASVAVYGDGLLKASSLIGPEYVDEGDRLPNRVVLHGHARTPAIALCITSIKARANQQITTSRQPYNQTA